MSLMSLWPSWCPATLLWKMKNASEALVYVSRIQFVTCKTITMHHSANLLPWDRSLSCQDMLKTCPLYIKNKDTGKHIKFRFLESTV